MRSSEDPSYESTRNSLRLQGPADSTTGGNGGSSGKMQIVAEIPAPLQPEVDAALAWLNAKRGRHFQVTGVDQARRPE